LHKYRHYSLSAEPIGELNRQLKAIDFVIVDGTQQRKNKQKNKENQKVYCPRKNVIQ
jgi:hypothetical protein